MLECVIPEAKYCKVHLSTDSVLFLIDLENEFFFSLLEDKKNVKFEGV